MLFDVNTLLKNENHFLIKEILNGKPVYITMIGKRFFACYSEKYDKTKIIDINLIPSKIRSQLKTLHKKLNLNLAEYYFRIVPKDKWYFIGYNRLPMYSIKTFGDEIYKTIITYIIKNER